MQKLELKEDHRQ